MSSQCRALCFCNGAESPERQTLLTIADAGTGDYGPPGEYVAMPPRNILVEDTPRDDVPERICDEQVFTPAEHRTFSREAALSSRLNDEEKAEIEALNKETMMIDEHKAHIADRLKDAEALVAKFKKDMKDSGVRRAEVQSRLHVFENRLHLLPKTPGPFEFVDSTGFAIVCNSIVLVNLAFMVKHSTIVAMSPALSSAADNVFLAWYVTELTFKFLHYKTNLFFGRCIAVSWNWLDLGIVTGGVLDQWVMPMISDGGGSSVLAALRILRLFRLLRFLKIIKAFLVADLSWLSDSKAFEMFMSAVVCVNGITIGLELDIGWHGWMWVDNGFLTVYFFDIALKLKRWGRVFFVHPVDASWNWLDFVVVGAGMLDSWLMPAIEIIQTEMSGVNSRLDTDKLQKVMSLMKLMRLLRVLRLVRVLRGIPPLYTMLIGCIEAFKSMQYVIILAIMTLYGGSIIFTSVVGQGLIYDDGHAPPEAIEYFGTVSQSFFSLFELMNGDTSVIEPIKGLLLGRMVFAGFMVIANWAILAILTAVVSDQMIAASQEYEQEENRVKGENDEKKNEQRLLELFEENDKDKNGLISKSEWKEMLEDPCTLLELAEGTHLGLEDLLDLFDCLSVEGDVGESGKIAYLDLIRSLKVNSEQADKRAVLHVMLRLRIMQDQMQENFQKQFDELKAVVQGEKQPSAPKPSAIDDRAASPGASPVV